MRFSSFKYNGLPTQVSWPKGVKAGWVLFLGLPLSLKALPKTETRRSLQAEVESHFSFGKAGEAFTEVSMAAQLWKTHSFHVQGCLKNMLWRHHLLQVGWGFRQMGLFKDLGVTGLSVVLNLAPCSDIQKLIGYDVTFDYLRRYLVLSCSLYMAPVIDGYFPNLRSTCLSRFKLELAPNFLFQRMKGPRWLSETVFGAEIMQDKPIKGEWPKALIGFRRGGLRVLKGYLGFGLQYDLLSWMRSKAKCAESANLKLNFSFQKPEIFAGQTVSERKKIQFRKFVRTSQAMLHYIRAEHYRGQVHALQKRQVPDDQKIRQYCQKGVALNVGEVSAECNWVLGRLYLQENEVQKARECFAQGGTLNIGEASAKCDWKLGKLYLEENAAQKAQECFERGIALNVGEGSAGCNEELGQLYLSHHQEFDKVMACFERGMALNAGKPSAFCGWILGRLYLQEDEIAAARNCFERGSALKVGVASAACDRELGRLFLNTGELAQARKSFKRGRALQATGLASDGELELGRLYLQAGSMEKAQACFERGSALQASGPAADCELELGRLHLQVGRIEKAQACFERGSAFQTSEPLEPSVKCDWELGNVYLLKEDDQKAQACFERGSAWRLGEYSACCDEKIGLAYLKDGEHEKARAYFERAIALSAGKCAAWCHWHLGVSHYNDEAFPMARQYFEKGRDLKAGDPSDLCSEKLANWPEKDSLD